MAEEENATIRSDEQRHADEADQFLDDVFADDVLAELERRNELERVGRIGAHVIIELQDHGPLYLYVMQRRKEASAALLALSSINPRDGIAIAEHQAIVREYLKITSWIDRRLEQAKEAEIIINEGYGSEHPDTADDAEQG